MSKEEAYADDSDTYALLFRNLIEGAAAVYWESYRLAETIGASSLPELDLRARWLGFTEQIAAMLVGRDNASLLYAGLGWREKRDERLITEVRDLLQDLGKAILALPQGLPAGWLDTFVQYARDMDGSKAPDQVAKLMDVPHYPPTEEILRRRAKLYMRLIVPVWLQGLGRFGVDTTNLRDEWFPRI